MRPSCRTHAKDVPRMLTTSSRCSSRRGRTCSPPARCLPPANTAGPEVLVRTMPRRESPSLCWSLPSVSGQSSLRKGEVFPRALVPTASGGSLLKNSPNESVYRIRAKLHRLSASIYPLHLRESTKCTSSLTSNRALPDLRSTAPASTFSARRGRAIRPIPPAPQCNAPRETRSTARSHCRSDSRRGRSPRRRP
jgi:hypothetical protein